MRKIEKVAAELALKSSTNNEPVWVQGFLMGVDHAIKEGSKLTQAYVDKANKLLKNEDPEKPYSEIEKLDLKSKMDIGRVLSAKLQKIQEEEAD